MKFIIYGNAPHVPTGYGVQIGHLCRQLKREGHDVAVACTFGHQVGVRQWPTEYGPVTLYPSGWLENSLDVLQHHAMHFFDGDPHGGYIIPVTDQWVLLPSDLSPFKLLAWTPVDHWPVPPEVLKFFHKSKARCLSMSAFGVKQMVEAGHPADYVPLMVDTNTYKPTTHVMIDGDPVPARELFDIPESAGFVALMVAMNKDPQDRKNFNGAFRAFGRFWREHQDAVLYVHTDKYGIAGSHLNLVELARHAAIPPHAIKFSNTYAVQIGFSPEMMAALYSCADVLLTPSKGEGFGVPMIEAQACGTPVIASDFTAQTELVGAGWKVSGQLEWDHRQMASYLTPSTEEIANALMKAYEAKDDADLKAKAVEFAQQFDVSRAWEANWKPILDSLVIKEPEANKPKMDKVAVLVPVLNRPQNVDPLVLSFLRHSPPEATLYFIADKYDTAQLEAIDKRLGDRVKLIPSTKGSTFAAKINDGYEHTTEDFVFICGDDVDFTNGWLDAPRELSDRYDVIGTNDSETGRVRNEAVANGSHADHFFVRRSYVDDDGACLEGPGVLAPEVFQHWYTDKEIIELAKVRGVFAPCLASHVIHNHPGYDGREDLRQADPTYMAAVSNSESDMKTWIKRAGIIAGMR